MAFFYFFLGSAVTKRSDFFLLFSTVLKRFCPGDSKNVFVLVVPHLEPEPELFEVNDIGDDGDDVAPLSSKLQTALARVVDESGPKRIHF